MGREERQLSEKGEFWKGNVIVVRRMCGQNNNKRNQMKLRSCLYLHKVKGKIGDIF